MCVVKGKERREMGIMRNSEEKEEKDGVKGRGKKETCDINTSALCT